MARKLQQVKRLIFFKQWRDLEGHDGALDQALKALIAQQATAAPEHDETWLHRLLLKLEGHWRDAGRVPRPSSMYAIFGAFPFAGLLFVLFLCGMGSFYFGSGGNIHLLANPFLALLIWHLGLYLLRAVMLFKHQPSGWFTEWVSDRLQERLNRLGEPNGGKVTWREARAQFCKVWLSMLHRVIVAEIYVNLHRCSLALTLGMIAGLYLNGTLRAYRFSWDSTFLQDPATVETLLTVLFWPLQLLRGAFGFEALPPLEGANGAAWIHFYAQAAALYILVPRLVMAILAWRKCQPTQAELQQLLGQARLDQWAYFLAGTKPQVSLIGYSYHLKDTAVARAVAGIEAYLDNDISHQYSFLAWGAQADDLPWPAASQSAKPWWLAVCLNAAQTPEAEIHGDFFAGIAAHPVAQEQRVLLLFDITKLDPARAQQRLQAWRELATAKGLSQFLELELHNREQWVS